MVRRSIALISLILLGGVGVSLLTYASNDRARLISVHDQGETVSFKTEKATIGEALRDAGIMLDARDSVEPDRDEELVADTYQVNIYRVRPVTVIDGTIRIKILTSRQTPAQIAHDANLTLHDEDVTTLSRSTVASDGVGQTLHITRATPVVLDFYGKKTTVRTQARTVKQFLDERQLTLKSRDRVSHSVDTPITYDMSLRIWREGIQTITQEEPIRPSSRIVYDVNRPLGYRGVKTKGIPGSRTVVYQVEIRHGKEISREQLRTLTSKNPTSTITVIGLKNNGSGLTLSKGAQHYTDSNGVSHRETYYDLPMGVVMQACGQGGHYTVRPDGAKVDADGYVIIAANYGNYPRCSVVETSLGPGKVYDTGGFAARHPHGFDLATDWTSADGI